MECGDVNIINMTQDKVYWRILVNTVTNLRVSLLTVGATGTVGLSRRT
jgi:hypothetical protein